MSTSSPRSNRWKTALLFVLLAGLVGGGVAAWRLQDRWLPHLQRLIAAGGAPTGAAAGAEESGHDHDHAGHDHAGHDETSSIELSPQARKNIGLETLRVTPGRFERTISVPGIIVEKPGQTRTRVVAPLTGIVTRIFAAPGEAVRAGQPLFEVRLTHEDMVQSQVDFLKTVEELAVVEKEIARLKPVSESGAVPQKTLIDRQYEQQRLQGSLKAQRESLLLHGLTEQQADAIQEKRTLQSRQTVFVPSINAESGAEGESQSLFVIEDIRVEPGRYVGTGDLLLTLADYSELYVEGDAFEQDGNLIAEAVRQDHRISIRIQDHTADGALIPDLQIQYLSDQIDPASRTLHFYLRLPNELVRDVTRDGRRYLNWKFRPGQRTDLLVPVEEWTDRIVVPADAVVQDGAETYVFQENGDHFDRRPVHVEFRNRFHAVIANDGSVFPGDVIAATAAQQLLLALKNKSGGGIDPHAGHNH